MKISQVLALTLSVALEASFDVDTDSIGNDLDGICSDRGFDPTGNFPVLIFDVGVREATSGAEAT